MPHEAVVPLTLADWRQAWREGAPVRPTLLAHLGRWAEQAAAPAWLLRLDAKGLEPRLQQLEALAAATPDREALLQRHPLFGVPFAIKDNIDAFGMPTTAACPAWSRTATEIGRAHV